MDESLAADTLTDDPSPAAGLGPALASSSPSAAAGIITAFDPSALAEYVADLAVLILNASRDDLSLSLLAYPDTVQKCSRFASDANSQSLYLRKDTSDATLPTGPQNGSPHPYVLQLSMYLCVDRC
jgi:hypothetical protein